MSQPPNHQKEYKEHMIHPIETANMTFFPVPPSTFEILKRGLHAPTQLIIGDTLVASWQIRNDQKWLFFIFLPIGTQIGLDAILLPQTNRPIKSFPRLAYHIRDGTGWQETTLS